MKPSILFCIVIALGIISCAQEKNKTAQTTSAKTKTVTMQKVQMSVDGMVCNACQSKVKKAIKSIDGVTNVEVSLENKYALFTYEPQKVKIEQVQKAVNDKGYAAGKPQEVKQ